MDKMREEFEVWYEEITSYPVEFGEDGNPSPIGCPLSHNVTLGMWAGWKASRAALSENHSPDAAEMVFPEGWQLVPVEPTEAMISSVIDAGTLDADDVAYFWDSMLSAAPKHEGGEP